MIKRIFFFAALMTLSPPLAGAAPGAAPDASAPLVLIGVVPGTGQALIWKAVSEEYVLIRVGERCLDYQLRRLLRDRVILARGDSGLVLTLDSTPLVGPGEQRREAGGLPASIHTAKVARRGQPAPPVVEPQRQDPGPPMPASPPAVAPSSVPASAADLVPEPIKLGEGVQVISLLSLRKEVSSFMHGLSPYHVKLSAGGIQVTGIKAGSLLHTLGLEEGDEIVSIGGVQVSSRQEALNAYLTFAPDREVELQLLRQGAPRTLSFRLSS